MGLEASNSADVYEQLLTRVGEANPRPRIEPVSRLAKYLGDPQLTFPVIHVAGTNGKTSTARAIEILLRSHGLRTGVFTSPHLIDFAERIRIDGEAIGEPELLEAYEEILTPLEIVDAELEAEGLGPITFFEALTVLALVAFADAPIDVAVIEVGMGGEWDSTNIVHSDVSVFTKIDLDHTSILGNNLQQIAKTKSGIIKSESIVVAAAGPAEVTETLREAALEKNAKFLLAGKDFELTADVGAVDGRMFNAIGPSGAKYEHVLLPLFGRYQSENTLLALAAVEAYFGLERAIPEQVLNDAMASLTSPGRLQIIANDPLVLVDAAHNPAGAAETVRAIEEHFMPLEILLVLGVLEDKDISGVIAQLLPIATRVHATAIDSPRSSTAESIAATVSSLNSQLRVDEFDSSAEALLEAKAWAEAGVGRAVLVAGSVVLAGEALATANSEGWNF